MGPSCGLRVGGFAKPFSLTRKVKRNPHYGLPAGKCADCWRDVSALVGAFITKKIPITILFMQSSSFFCFIKGTGVDSWGNQIVFDAG
jgi:hypothetical protein